jgi:flagellin
MASFINTNMVALNTQNNLSKSQESLAQSIKRLSTGLRINSAKDDAAGLAISNRMDATIRGQTVAIRNTNDAVSFSQTADGALGQINNNLQRLRELAVQASNGTNSAGDRQLLNTEFNQLQQEVTRIQNNTAFNGTNAMQSNSVTVQIGAGTTQYDKIQINGIDLSQVSATTKTDSVTSNNFTRAQFDAAKATLAKTDPARANNISFNETNGHVYEMVSRGMNYTDAQASAQTSSFGGQKGYLATISNAEENNFAYNKTGGNWTWINGTKDAAIAGTGAFVGNPLAGVALNSGSAFSYTGTTAPETGKLTYTNFPGSEPNGTTGETAAHLWGGGTWNDLNAGSGIYSMVEYGGSSTATASTAASNITTVGTGVTTLGTYQVNDGSTITAADAAAAGLVDGAGHAITTDLTAGQLFYVATKGTDSTSYSAPASFDAITNAHKVTSDSQKAAASDLAVFGNASGVNILTQADALSAIDSIDKAMLQVNVAQIQQGATQNRLQAIISTLTSSNESTINARSHIMDTDFAAETASMARAQILQQAGMAMLAQANTSNNGIMALMR